MIISGTSVTIQASDVQAVNQEEANDFIGEILTSEGVSAEQIAVVMQDANSVYEVVLLYFAACLQKKQLIQYDVTVKFENQAALNAAAPVIVKALEANATPNSELWEQRLLENQLKRKGLL